MLHAIGYGIEIMLKDKVIGGWVLAVVGAFVGLVFGKREGHPFLGSLVGFLLGFLAVFLINL